MIHADCSSCYSTNLLSSPFSFPTTFIVSALEVAWTSKNPSSLKMITSFLGECHICYAFANQLQNTLMHKIVLWPYTLLFGDGYAYQFLICSLKTDTYFNHFSLGTQGFKGWIHASQHKPERVIKQMVTINRIGTHQGLESLIKSFTH